MQLNECLNLNTRSIRFAQSVRWALMIVSGVCLFFSLQVEAEQPPASGEPADCEDPAFLSRLGQILENTDAESRRADLARLGADLPPHLIAKCPQTVAKF